MRKAGDSGVPDKPWKKHVGILAYDLRGYGKRPSHERRAAQERLERYAKACTPPGATQLGWRPTGDGGFIFFDGPLGSNFDAVGLFRAEMTELGIDPLPDVRFALHDGHVNFNGSDYDGPGLILVSRLLDGMPRLPSGMTVVSGELAELLRDDWAKFDTRMIRLLDIPSKERPLVAFAAVATSEFAEGASELFSDGFGPRPWGFQHHDWIFHRDEVAAFLEDQPKYIPAGFAARAALRSVSVLARFLEINDKNADAILAPILYAMAPPLAAGLWPTRGGDVADAAFAAHAAADAAAFAAPLPAAHAPFAAFAAHIAADAQAAAAAADAAFAAHVAAAAADAAFAAPVPAAHTTAAADADDLRAVLGTRGDAANLKSVMSSPLWPGGYEPDGFSDDLSTLRSGLLALDPSWSVWFDWYEQRLRGASVDVQKELARATALTEEDYEKGAMHMNRKVMAALEKFERDRSPTPGTVDISPEEQKIVRRETPPVDVPSKPGLDVPEFFAELRDELVPTIRQFGEPTMGNIVPQLREAVTDLGAMLAESEKPRTWFTKLEAIRIEIGKYVDLGDPDTIPFRINVLLNMIRSHELELQDKFPEEARVHNARRSQHQRPLTDEQKAAFREVVDAAIDAISPDLQETFDELLDDDTPVVKDDLAALRDQPLTVEQRDRLYRLKALMLRVKELVKQSPETLGKILGRAENAAKAVDRFVRVAEKFDEVWDRIASFLTSG